MQSRVKLFNSNQVWNAKKRYKINEVVTLFGTAYQNTTGRNSNPSDLTDWIKTSGVSGESVPYFSDFTFVAEELGFILPTGVKITAVSVNRVSQFISEWTQTGTLLTINTPPDDGSVVTVSGIY